MFDLHKHRVQTDTPKLRASVLREVLGENAKTRQGELSTVQSSVCVDC